VADRFSKGSTIFVNELADNLKLQTFVQVTDPVGLTYRTAIEINEQGVFPSNMVHLRLLWVFSNCESNSNSWS
jgi:hypothetical protein